MRNRLLPFQGWRLTFFQGVIFAIFLIFSLRMYQMQIVEGINAQLAADDNRLNEQPIAAPRGVIFDRYSQILASNVPAYVVRIIPAELPGDREAELEIFNRLSALTGVPSTRALADAAGSSQRSIEEIVIEGLGFAPFQPVVIAQDVPQSVAQQILEESYELPGVTIQEAAVRQYPSGEATSHIIGYMGPIPPEEQLALLEQGYDPAFDRIGYDGLERYLESILAGQRGAILREIDVAGEEQEQLSIRNPVPGQNIRLTIDLDLQEFALNALRDRINAINLEAARQAEGLSAGDFRRTATDAGVVIVMDPNTGEILSLVSYPTYDNARFARSIDVEYYLELLEENRNPLLNQSIGSLYPPGSAWKLITAASVAEEGVIDPETRLYDGGDLLLPNFYAENDRAADQRFVCWNRNGHGYVNLIEAIAASCNVYFYQVGGGYSEVETAGLLRPGGLGIDDLVRYSTALGIGSELGVELPGELTGRMPDRDWKRINVGENWSTGDTYNAAFGQGYIQVTPLQLINSVAALVNNGVLYQPTIIRDFLDEEGNVAQSFEPQILRTVNLDYAEPDGSIRLLLLEDMIIQGSSSLACTCEENSPYYNGSRCDPEGYRASVDLDPSLEREDFREYTIHIPMNYTFNASVCNTLRFDPNYVPAFLSSESMGLVREGMRQAVVNEVFGTARGADLDYVAVAGKTGTAEYCDNIAYPLGLCEQGNWPAHAWFTAYAPYDDPEVLIVVFIYNGKEGSGNALPVAVEILEEYFRLKSEREGALLNLN